MLKSEFQWRGEKGGCGQYLDSLSKFSISSAEREQNGHGRNLAGFTTSLTADVKMFTYYDLVAISFSAVPSHVIGPGVCWIPR